MQQQVVHEQVIAGIRYRWDGTDWARVDEPDYRRAAMRGGMAGMAVTAAKHRDPKMLAYALSGFAVLVVVLAASITAGRPAATTDTTTAAVFTSADLQTSIADTDSTFRDVDCLAGTIAADGTGWWLCSWRVEGEPTPWVYTVEVSDGGRWAAQPAGVAGPVRSLTSLQRADLLAA